MTDPDRSLESASVAAILAQRSHQDRAALLDELALMLSEIVPRAQVKRAFIGKRVTAVHLPLDGYVYVLKRSANDTFEASRQQEVRGVVIRTDPMDIEGFLEELGLALDVELRRTERGREAFRAWMNSTGG
jgi:hypothetical protein